MTRLWSGKSRSVPRETIEIGRPSTLNAGLASRRPACCSVEISASVDSAPWLRLGPRSTEPVVASTAVGIEHRGVGVVVAEEPGDRPLDAGRPAVIFDVVSGPSAGVRQGGNLNRLLVEGGPWVPGVTPARRRYGQVTVVGLMVQQPCQQFEPVVNQDLAPQGHAGRDHRVG